jgi:hypothetical protein
MFRQMIRLAAIGTATAAVVMTVGAWTPANATDDFGDHVSTCAQTLGFGADHNPGMHQGRHGWDHPPPC